MPRAKQAHRFGCLTRIPLTVVAMLPALSAAAGSAPLAAQGPTTTKPKMTVGYGSLPLHFEPNQGQTEGTVKFLARGRGYGLFLTATEAVLALRPGRAPAPSGEAAMGQAMAPSSAGPPSVLTMKLLGANPRPVVAGQQELGGKSNYLIGNDPTKWRTNVPQYARVRYEDVYPGVSLAYYGHEGQIEYDFVVAPGADAGRIRLGIDGATAVRVDADGNLVLGLPQGEIVERAPVVYQEIEGARRAVEGRFVLRGAHEVGFQVGNYEADRPLVLDPLLVYSTLLGGSGDDLADGIALDAEGNAYVTGSTTSADFPTREPLQGTKAGFGGTSDVFVAKVNAGGSDFVYSTYLGGTGSEQGIRIAVDASGNAYVTGTTNSQNFPTVNPVQPTFGGYGGINLIGDGFAFKLDASGSALVYSTYLGGSGADVGLGIAVDAAGSAYVTGYASGNNFPTTANAFQPTHAGCDCLLNTDAFVTKLSASGALVYSTYLGGGDGDAGADIAVDAAGEAYVTGTTQSTDFPTANPLQATSGTHGDAFVTKLNAAGSALVYSTYLGGSGSDGGASLALDALGNAYVLGVTGSTDFPTVAPLQPAKAGGSGDAFVAKLNAAGSALVYSTYLGGQGGENACAIAVDASGAVYVVGVTNSTDFPTVNALQAASAGGTDGYVAKLDSSGAALLFSTYLGGNGDDTVFGVAVDGSQNIYVSGWSSFFPGLSPGSPNTFPTSHPLQAANAGGQYDGFIAKIGAGTPPRGDFDADGDPDILWRNPTTGEDAVWLLNGTTFDRGSYLPFAGDLNWDVVGAARFNADVRTDILWRNRTTGENVVWFMNGSGSLGSVFLPTVSDLAWQIAATADLDGDGQADILWRNQATGDDLVWFMNGTNIKGGAVLTPVNDTSWRIVAAADFNRDGNPDILWRNQATGDNLVWFLDGTSVTGGAVLSSISDRNWVVGAVADYNADGKTDILWHNQATGETVVWIMDDVTVAGGVVLPTVSDPHWTVVGPR